MTFDEEKLNGDLPTIPLIAVLHSTNNFSEESILGEGGFGSVYKVLMIWNLTDSSHLVFFYLFSFLATFIREFYQMEDKLQ